MCAGDERVGKFAASAFTSLDSTSQAMRAVRAGRILVNGATANHAQRVIAGDAVILLPPKLADAIGSGLSEAAV